MVFICERNIFEIGKVVFRLEQQQELLVIFVLVVISHQQQKQCLFAASEFKLKAPN